MPSTFAHSVSIYEPRQGADLDRALGINSQLVLETKINPSLKSKPPFRIEALDRLFIHQPDLPRTSLAIPNQSIWVNQ